MLCHDVSCWFWTMVCAVWHCSYGKLFKKGFVVAKLNCSWKYLYLTKYLLGWVCYAYSLNFCLFVFVFWPVLSMADGGRPKFFHINMPLWFMVLPWQAFLHKLPMVVGKKSTLPFCLGCYLATLVLAWYDCINDKASKCCFYVS